MNRIYIYTLTLLLSLCGSSCNDFLDEIPDNRVELNSEAKMNQLLLGSYTRNLPLVVAEFLSDNVDHKTGVLLSSAQRYQDEAYAWEDIQDESGNDSPKDVWGAAYTSIAAANQVLQSIEEQGNPVAFAALKGEALMLRAFNHFLLVNLYGLHYNDVTSETDPGIVYMEAPETDLNPHYERESVAEIYRKLVRDIEEALPLIRDDIYKYPKYRFNRQASLAFAARVNLYYGKYDKVIAYANQLFGNNPASLMRDKYHFKSMTRDFAIFAQEFTSLSSPANFLLLTPVSTARTYFGNYTTAKLYQHTYFIADHETTRSPGPWGSYRNSVPYTFNIHSSSFTSSNYNAQPHIYGAFRTTNPIANTGVNYATFVTFWAEETLLCRAEAYIAKGEFDKATADLALWMDYQIDPSINVTLTRELINDYYGNLAYFEPEAPTPKKRLNPLNMTITSEEQENFLHCLLHFRRIETISLGLRWYDVKRFGIEIHRRDIEKVAGGDEFVRVTDVLTLNDPRRALQIPPDVISAGMTPTPR